MVKQKIGGFFMRHLTNDYSEQWFIGTDVDLISQVQLAFYSKYKIDLEVASELAVDFIDMLAALDGNFSTLKKYFLH